jgi:hypothetical protein
MTVRSSSSSCTIPLNHTSVNEEAYTTPIHLTLSHLGSSATTSVSNPHIILPKSRNTHTSSDRLMVRNPLLGTSRHGCKRFVVGRHMVRVDAEDLRPAFSDGIVQIVLDLFETFVDLRVDFEGEVAVFTV